MNSFIFSPYILTKYGLLPNDHIAQQYAWNSSTYCSMSECMNKEQFNEWWAKQIEKKYEEYLKQQQQKQQQKQQQQQQQQLTCYGCLNNQPNQKCHMEPGGCLYFDDSL